MLTIAACVPNTRRAANPVASSNSRNSSVGHATSANASACAIGTTCAATQTSAAIGAST